MKWRDYVKYLKAEVLTLYLAYRDPRTPWYARVFTAVVVSYALSPIDLIPDFIPVLGVLDDLLLVPAGLVLAIKMIPTDVIIDAREKAKEISDGNLPISRTAACAIIFIWLTAVILLVIYSIRLYTGLH